MKPVLILGREPAVWNIFVSSLIYALGAFVLHFSDGQEAALIAVAAGVLGLVVAWLTHDGWSALALGLTKAVLVLALAFGLDWSAAQQAVAMSLAAAVVGMFVRTQASAPVSAAEAP